MNPNATLSFIVPAHNEQACLADTLRAIHESATPLAMPMKLLWPMTLRLTPPQESPLPLALESSMPNIVKLQPRGIQVLVPQSASTCFSSMLIQSSRRVFYTRR